MVQGIIIPADNTAPPRTATLDSLADYQPAVYRVRAREHAGGKWREEPVDRDDYLETVIWATLLQEMSPTLKVGIGRVDNLADESNEL
jgi:hypothetical protein